jgi:TRAP-type C4-dicarboxylate transport system substrate-binding protein
MVRKIQRGGLDAVTISASGLTFVDRNMDCLALPLLLESYEELDYVRAGMTPTLEKILEARKLKLLHWAEAGWIYFFSKTPIRTPADLRSQRLWTGTGQPELEVLFKQFGFKVVPLPATEMLTALQTGLVDVIDVPPLSALLDNSYQVANYMTELKWAPLNAATLISVRKWAQIPAEYKPKLLKDAQAVARDLRDVNRAADESAIAEMKARGLNVVELSAEELAVWRADAEQAYPKLRGSYVDPELFDEVMRLHEEYRSKKLSPTSP